MSQTLCQQMTRKPVYIWTVWPELLGFPTFQDLQPALSVNPFKNKSSIKKKKTVLRTTWKTYIIEKYYFNRISWKTITIIHSISVYTCKVSWNFDPNYLNYLCVLNTRDTHIVEEKCFALSFLNKNHSSMPNEHCIIL